MKRLLLFSVLLSFHIYTEAEAQELFITDECAHKYSAISASWDSLWNGADERNYLFMNLYGDSLTCIDHKDYIKRRKKLHRVWNKQLKKERQDNEAEMMEYFRSRLRTSIMEKSDSCILSDANLYVNLLHDDNVNGRVFIYENVMLPIYKDAYDINSLYYIYKLMIRYADKYPDNQMIQNAMANALRAYEEARDNMPEYEKLKGIWFSNVAGKNKLPEVILRICENEHEEYYAILDESSGYSKKHMIKGSIYTKAFQFDEIGHPYLYFCHEEYKEGMSPAEVAALASLVDNTGQAVAKGLTNIPNLGNWGSSLVSLGISAVTSLFIASFGNASKNTLVNSYIGGWLTPSDEENEMTCCFSLKSEKRESNHPEVATVTNVADTFQLYKLLPEDEIIFIGKGVYPITDYNRLAYVTPEFYNVYDSYRKYRNMRTSIRSLAPLYCAGCLYVLPAYIGTSSRVHNKREMKKFNELIER